MDRKTAGFTLVEILVVIAIIAVLSSLVMALIPSLKRSAQKAASLSNLRQIGMAVYTYAGDNEYNLPRRISSGDKWPKLLGEYLKDVRVYAAVGDPQSYIARHATNPMSNDRNETSYIMNGFNDIGAYTNENAQVRLNRVDTPSQVILFGTPKSGSTHFYMDMLEGEHGNHVDVLNLEAFDGGSVYLMADSSSRWIKSSDYDPRMWLVNTNFAVP